MGSGDEVLSRRDLWLLAALATAFGGSVLLWLAAVVTALAHDYPPPSYSALGTLRVLIRPADAAGRWGITGASAFEYWAIVLGLALTLAGAAILLLRRTLTPNATKAWNSRAGIASRSQTAQAAGAQRIKGRVRALRPSMDGSTSIGAVSHAVGHGRGVKCLVTVEDSTVILGPPRSGKVSRSGFSRGSELTFRR